MIAVMSESKKKPGRPRDPESKRSAGDDRHKDPRIVLHLEEELLQAMEDYRNSLPHRTGRSQIARDFLRDALRSLGFFPPKQRPGGGSST